MLSCFVILKTEINRGVKIMLSVEEQLKNCIGLADEAKRMGCDRVSMIWSEDVVFDPRVTLKCRQNSCGHYGKNFMCPPFVPTGQEFRQSALKYKVALLLQQEREIPPESKQADIDKEFKTLVLSMRRILVSLEKKAFEQGFIFCSGLGGGECKLCEICGARSGAESCSRPNEARPSMEAVGIDVAETCRKAGFPALFQKGTLSVTGLLFIT